MTDLYHSTRQSWEHIWDDASVEAELETLRFARSQEAMAAYLPYLPRDGVILEAVSYTHLTLPTIYSV